MHGAVLWPRGQLARASLGPCDKCLSFQNWGAASELPVVMLLGPGCPWTVPRHCLGEC